MLKIESIDLEFATMNKEPEFGYEEEYKEYTMLSGKKRRVYKKGRRLVATVEYAYLTDEQIAQIYSILDIQKTKGYLRAEISTAKGDFSGNVNISLDNKQTRFGMVNGRFVWLNFELTIQGVDMI